MNAQQKAQVERTLVGLQASLTEITKLREDTQDRYDAGSETWQDSDKGQEVSNQVEALEASESSLEDAIDQLSNL